MKLFFSHLKLMISSLLLFILTSFFIIVTRVSNDVNWKSESERNELFVSFPVEMNRNLHIRSGKKYLITVGITDDSPQLREKVKTTIDMLSLYQRYYRLKPVVFSQSDAVLQYARQKKVEVITEVDRNEFGVPIYRSLLSSLKKRYRSLLYGYMNSDILIDPSIFSFINQMDLLHKRTNIPVLFKR